jgi:predicted translin family RNA/ssDNA-binding protein
VREWFDGRNKSLSDGKRIFALQRIQDPFKPIPDSINATVTRLWDEVYARLEDLKPDCQGLDQWRYQKNISGGVQECIEAMSFEHFLVSREIITIEQVKSRVPTHILITDEDYVLGLMDLTGELMRYAIGRLSEVGDDHHCRKASPIAVAIYQTMKDFDVGLRGLDIHKAGKNPGLKDLSQKVSTFNGSLIKVEQAMLSLAIRGDIVMTRDELDKRDERAEEANPKKRRKSTNEGNDD